MPDLPKAWRNPLDINHYENQPERIEDKKFYKGKPWRATRARKLASQPLCEDCLRNNAYVAAKHVHHIKERKDYPELALDPNNLESVCPSCHNSKRRKRLAAEHHLNPRETR